MGHLMGCPLALKQISTIVLGKWCSSSNYNKYTSHSQRLYLLTPSILVFRLSLPRQEDQVLDGAHPHPKTSFKKETSSTTQIQIEQPPSIRDKVQGPKAAKTLVIPNE